MPETLRSKGLSVEKSRRRSMRVLLSVTVLVQGTSQEEQNFEEETNTLVVNAHGALISLAAPVAPGQLLMITNTTTQESLACTVVYVGNMEGGKAQIGVEFVIPSAEFWRISFPPEDWEVSPD
jgi:hypothetical protein